MSARPDRDLWDTFACVAGCLIFFTCVIPVIPAIVAIILQET